MKRRLIGGALVLGLAAFVPEEGRAQNGETEQPEAAAPAEGAPPGDVPPVDVEQPAPVVEAEEPAPAPAPKPKPRPRPVVAAPPPPRPPASRPAPVEPTYDIPSEITEPLPGFYGPPGGQSAFERAMDSAQSPIVPTQGIVPGNLQDFSSAASRVTRQQIDEQQPFSTNDILQRVPGVAIVNDDGFGRHGGISIRGTPARRSRKVLVMEDGRSINQSLWLDPSTHYTPPDDRIEQVEVLRGTVITYGPNNNSGVVNFRNLSPFGPSETVVSGQGGSVSLGGRNIEDGVVGDGHDSAAKWHVHTRQSTGDWGLVLSYTGANVQGAWDTERLRYHDFYGALGWKGEKSDFTFTTVYFAQRDNYDESNLEGDEDEDPPGEVENLLLHEYKHCKTCFNPGSRWNEYNADIVLLQGVYNYYVDPDTTVSARVYGQIMDRARFFNIEEANPREAEGSLAPIIVDDDGELSAVAAEGSMEGRYRTFDHIGTELRTEFANRPFLFGLSQDLQVGVRYEHHKFTDRSFLGRQGEIMTGFQSRGLDVWNREFTADAFSAFLQTDIEVTDRLNVVPGARLETYKIDRLTKVLTVDDEEEDCPPALGGDDEECVFFEGYTDTPFKESMDRTHVLPGAAFAYGFGAKQAPVEIGSKSLGQVVKAEYASTIYGGYHRGLTMGVLREVSFPTGDEIGDNFQIGLRSTAIKGFTFDVAGFHQRIQDYQFASEVTLSGDRTFESVDEVHVNGFELYGRLDTQPYTGWKLNPYTEASFTLADTKIEKGVLPNEDDEFISVAGNYVPEVPREFAYLTAGIESPAGWNASVSWIYRGAFYTDAFNTPFAGNAEGEVGEVPSVWLLAARANYTIPNTGATLFISGENLTDEVYITDREDGVKPGLGRTLMAGAKYRW